MSGSASEKRLHVSTDGRCHIGDTEADEIEGTPRSRAITSSVGLRLLFGAATPPELPPATLRITIPPGPSRPVQLVGDVMGPAGCGEVSLSLRRDPAVVL